MEHAMTWVRAARAARIVAFVALLMGFADAAWAQRPSEAEIAAIRQACRSDFIAHCAGVTPGGAEALLCLREHLASLSAACQEAVNAAGTAAPAATPAAPPPAAAAPAPAAAAPETPAPAPAAGTAAALQRMRPNQEQLGIIVQACATDMDANCASDARGAGWELKCLRDNAANLSLGCQQVLAAVASTAPAEPAAAPAPPPPPAAAAPPPAAPAAAAPAPAAPQTRPTRGQLITILQACRADVGAHCAGAERAPGWRLKCLRDNAASLTPGCQRALAAVASGAPAEPAAAAPSAPPPAAAVPRMERPVSPRDMLILIRTSCSADFRTYCRGVPFGGGRVIGCLRENAANLSPICQQAFMALVGGR
jgi:hypothetical protein